MLWRRKWLLAGAAVVGLTGGYFFARAQTPLFRADAQIMLEARRVGGDVPSSMAGDIELNDAALLTELEVLRSNILMERVVTALDLAGQPEFSADLAAPPAWHRLVDRLAAGLGVEIPFSRTAAAPTPDQIVEALQSRVEVEREGNSYAINIAATSEVPARAAVIIDEIARQYIGLQFERRQDSLIHIADWFDLRIASLRQRVEAAEEKVEALRAENLAAEGTGLAAISSQLANANLALAEARSQLAAHDARLHEFYNRLSSGSNDVTALVEGNATVATLRQHAADLSAQKTDLSVTYGSGSNRVARVQEREAAIRRELAEAVERHLTSVRDEAALRVGSASADLHGLEQRAQELSEASLRLRQAEREAATLQQVYANLLIQQNENDARQPLPQADARVVARAIVPQQPSVPNDKLIMALGGVLGLGLGLGGVMLSEHRHRALRTKADIEADLRLPLLATVPTGRWGRRGWVIDWMRRRDGLAFMEAIRQLRTALLFSSPRPPQVIMVASAGVGEGKTTIAIALASLFASVGKRVLLVDGDLRRPSVATATKLRPRWGLGAVLAGESTTRQAAVYDPELGFDVLAQSQLGSAATVDALSTPAFRTLIEDLKAEYEMVIFDTAPILYASDAIAIGKMADSALFVVREGVSLVHEVQEAVLSLMDRRIPIAGIALNMSCQNMAYSGYDPQPAAASLRLFGSR